MDVDGAAAFRSPRWWWLSGDVDDPTPAAFARGARNFQTFETNFGPGRTWYWHGIDVTANARLGAGVNIQGARALDAACRIDARPSSKSTARIHAAAR